jgi:hypothetical protein
MDLIAAMSLLSLFFGVLAVIAELISCKNFYDYYIIGGMNRLKRRIKYKTKGVNLK